MLKIRTIAFVTFLILTISLSHAQNYPVMIGYYGGQSEQLQGAVNDTFRVTYGGGVFAPTQWKDHLNGAAATIAISETGSVKWMSGFLYNTVYIEPVFNKELFVSKGYYGDYVELRWDLARYVDVVTGFLIKRRGVESGDEFVQVANLPGDARDWQDEYSESNVLYEYKILAKGITSIQKEGLNYMLGVGFRTPTARVSGRITYESGAGVAGVRVVAETADDFSGASLILNGTTDFISHTPNEDDATLALNTFTFQGWFSPSTAIGSGEKTLMKKGDQYWITYEKSGGNGILRFKVANSTQTVSLTFPTIPDRFFHVSAIRTEDSLKVFTAYDADTTYVKMINLTAAPATNNERITIGHGNLLNGDYFKGNVDEIRVWNKALTFDEDLNTKFRYIAGTEPDLSIYYRLNEGLGEAAYDLSRIGFSFNEHHGDFGATVWSTKVPEVNQLSIKGITDANGDYSIAGIPYATDGNIYKIVPVFGVHDFNPNQQSLYLGPGATILSNIDFIDVASFPCGGYVYYKETDFPVKGVNVKIDGDLVIVDGTPYQSEAGGKFQFDVPIGQHMIQFVKNGHVFSNGEFTRNFQEPYTLQYDIIDSTLIKVIGKVVGGPVQAAKPKGLGRTVNNIGGAKIILSNSNYNYSDVGGGTAIYNHPYYEDALEVFPSGVTTNVTIPTTNLKTVEITPDLITGEYVAYLLPEIYTVNSVKAGWNGTSHTYNLGSYADIDLKNEYHPQTETDSIIHPVTPFVIIAGETIPFYQVDSSNYNKSIDFIYRVTPSVAVTKSDGTATFWEEEITVSDGNIIPLIESNGDLKTRYPIFIQREKYDLNIAVFENYIDPVAAVSDQVPVSDGKVKIINNLASNVLAQLYLIDTTGNVAYTFFGGKPSFNGNFEQSLSIVAITGNAGNIRTAWEPTLTAWSGNTYATTTSVFKGLLLGAMPKGNNFITKGPNQIDMTIRDPYGSQSYASYAVGNSVSKTTQLSLSNEIINDFGLTVSAGTNVTTWQGVGTGIITEVGIKIDHTLGMEATTTWLSDAKISETITNTKEWQTSAEEDFVGASGDVFIGRAMNIVYGTADRLELKATTTNTFTHDNIEDYDITAYETMRFIPEFATAFQFSQNHIENYLIPDLKALRENIIIGCCNPLTPYYTFRVTDTSDIDFGKKNTATIISYFGAGDAIVDPPVEGSSEYLALTKLVIDGDQYDIRLDFENTGAPNYWAGEPVDFIDRIEEYSESIKNWEAVLAQNEKEKLDAEIIENLSFDAGAVYSNSTTITASEEVTETFEFTTSPFFSTELGGNLNKTGVITTLSTTMSHKQTDYEGLTTESSVTFGYVLSDTDQGDYYSIDVKAPKTATGTVFAVKGGQSQCPYSGQELTKYYLPDSELSAATEQREVPTIACAIPLQINVPGDQPAFFEIELSNNSQSSNDNWYMLEVDEQTNQNGANIRLDGNMIGNGRVIYVPYVGLGQPTIKKMITIEQTNPAVVDYPDIKLIFHSICQYDPSNNVANIVDTVEISAHFIPVCASVTIDDPTDLWTRNIGSGASFDIDIGGYDLNRVDFERMLLQYKPSSSSIWSTAQTFYPTNISTVAYDAAVLAGQNPIAVTTTTIDNFNFDLTDQPDRTYDIRVKTECNTNTENFSFIASGIKDMKPPKIFGTPQPSDGILSPGENILLKFDEPIEAGILLSRNFSVRGVLNGYPIRHSSALYFDGIDDVAATNVGIDYTQKSFAIEFWIKRAHEGVEEIIYSQNGVKIGYKANDKMVVSLAGTEYLTTAEYSTAAVQANNPLLTDVTQLWMHYTVSYDALLEQVNLYVAYDGHNGTDIDRADARASASFNAAGKMHIGNDAAGTKAFKGFLHDFRVWEKEIDFGTSVANMVVNLNGDEIGLSGFWPMNDLKGEFATDLSRRHHAILSGPTWRVFPAGHAYEFNGATTASMPTASSVVISNEMDFTIEMWFKAAATQKGTVLFSNGMTDGTNSEAIEDIWEIGIDTSGLIYAKNKGEKVLQETGNFMDDQWHHLAVVMRRKSNTTIYLDGALNGFTHSSFFGGLKGAQMTLGANRDYFSVAPFTNHFTGAIDELRIWKLARTKELINLDLNSQLKGDEIGLVAYYPFDNWDINLLLVPSAEDLVIDPISNQLTGRVMTLAGGSYESENVPNIETPRPVQELNYNWLVNGDELIINILEQPSLIEKRIIEFTVENVEDKNQNLMSSPETWTAYIKQNTVVWSDDVADVETQQYAELTFDVDVINIGGTDQDFTISNLPSWLTASATSGNISPTSRQAITFSVGEFVNIGSYEEVLYLTTDFGYNERLHVKLKVVGERPDWSIDPTDFQYSMNSIGQVRIDSVVSVDVDDQLIALVDGDVRGVGTVAYYAGYDAYLVFMDIYSNSVAGDSVTFQVWDESAGKVHSEVTPDLTFADNSLVGTPTSPAIFNAINTFYEPIPVRTGWNWISFPLKSTKHASINQLLGNIDAETGDVLKGVLLFDAYQNPLGWLGSLTGGGGVNNAKGYKLNASNQDTIKYIGSKVDPSTVIIPISIGWNWIGFVSQKNLAINDAFTNYNVAHGDLLKSQQAFAVYDSILGWVGSLTFLEPKKGYMFKSSKVDALTYPDAELFNYKTGPTLSVEELYAEYEIVPQNFQDNMSAIIDVAVCDYVLEGEVLLAYVNGEIRGAANIIANKAFLTIYGNSASEITFKVKVATSELYAAIETMNYLPNAQEGTLLEPFKLQTNRTVADCDVLTSLTPPIEENHQNNEVIVIPVLFNEQLRIQYTLQEDAETTIALYGITGQKITTLMSASRVKGTHTLIWNTMNRNQELAEGLYFLRINWGGRQVIKKVVKTNN